MSRGSGLALLLIGVSLACLVTACSQPAAQAPADYLNAEYSSNGQPVIADAERIPSSNGRFATPHLGITQNSVLVTDVLDESTAQAVGLEDGQSFTAATGYEFVIATLIETDDGAGTEEGVVATIALAAGTETLELTELPGTLSDRLVVVASVPVGDPVTLKVEDAGQTVTWDLREANYAEDPVSQMTAIYGQVRGQERIGGFPTTTGQVLVPPFLDGLFPEEVGDVVVTVNFGNASFRVSPYVIGLGWAAADTTWAEVFGFTVTYESEVISLPPILSTVQEPAAAYSMTALDGQVYPLAGGNAALGTIQLTFDTQYAVFGVPFGFTGGTFTFAPQAPINGVGISSLQTATWTQFPPPVTIPVKIAG